MRSTRPAKAYELLQGHPGITLSNAVRGIPGGSSRIDRKSVPLEHCFSEYEALPKKREPEIFERTFADA